MKNFNTIIYRFCKVCIIYIYVLLPGVSNKSKFHIVCLCTIILGTLIPNDKLDINSTYHIAYFMQYVNKLYKISERACLFYEQKYQLLVEVYMHFILAT